MQQTIVKTYRGNQAQATKEFKEDAERMSRKGYVPTNQVWSPGSYGCGSFVIALLLCFVLIGILIFVYMLIVKPAGTLTVTYALAPKVDPEKVCPKCAERVKAAAQVCRFCGHEFDDAAQLDSRVLAPAVDQAPWGAEQFGRKLGRMLSKRS